MTEGAVAPKVIAVVVTHRRAELLAESLAVVSGQDRPVDHLIVVDNADELEVAELVAAQPVPTTYLGSERNLGGAGGFALGMLHALALGADWVWCADDDGRPDGPTVLSTLLDCAARHRLDEVSPVVVNIADPDTLADLEFAWRACRAVKSNAILLASRGASVGVGMGQVNRVDSAQLAVTRAGDRVLG